MDTLEIVITVVGLASFAVLCGSCISKPYSKREKAIRRRVMMITNRHILPINENENDKETMFQTREEAIQEWQNKQDETKYPEIVISVR